MGRNYPSHLAMKDSIALAGIVLALTLIVGGATTIALKLYESRSSNEQANEPAFGLSVCTVTTTLVSIGHQAATTVVSGGARSWAIIQQPVNATNTVAVSLGGTAAIGSGYELTPATSTSPVPQFLVGYATPLPYQGAISARTNAGSTTIKVIECK